jgi:IS30 family transposase
MTQRESKKEYKQLSTEEREKIYLGLAQGISLAEIGRQIGRDKSCISREVRRNKKAGSGYLPDTADNLAYQRKFKCHHKIMHNPKLRDYIIAKMRIGWSPEAISGRLRTDKVEAALVECWVCHETIYSFIYKSDISLKFGLYQLLCKAKPRRSRRGCRKNRGKIPDRISIHNRPPPASKRAEYGHYEADLVMFGRHKKNLITLIDRKSRYLAAFCNDNKNSTQTISYIKDYMKKLKTTKQKPLTITFDNGLEFSKHNSLHSIGIKTFFCDPYSSWQKGSIENANGIIRRYLPKSYDPSNLTQSLIDQIIDNINNTPRKILGYKTPAEILFG